MRVVVRIATLLGWKTRYHVSYVARSAAGQVHFFGDTEIAAAPWITPESRQHVRAQIAKASGYPDAELVVLGIFKLAGGFGV